MSAERKRTSHPESIVSIESAMQKLPHELWRQIFLINSRTDDLRSGHGFSLRVSWISQEWRNVALGIPELWSFIPINLAVMSERSSTVVEFLRRSQQCPLHVKITDSHIANESVERSVVSGLMQVLLPHLSRWHVLDLAFTHPFTFNFAFSFMHGNAVILRSLTLRCSVNTCVMIHPHFPADFSSPALSVLYLNKIAFPPTWRPSLHHPFNALEELTLHSHPPPMWGLMTTFVTTICQFSSLSSLTMIAALPSFDNLANAIPRCLARLTSVSFRSMAPDIIYDFFRRFTCPELMTVSIADVRGSVRDMFDVIFKELDSSGRFPQLHHLILNTAAINRDVLLAILAAPFAQQLTLHFNHNDSDVLLNMSQFNLRHGKWLCPRMQYLEVSASEVRSVTLQLVVKSRLEASREISPMSPSAIQRLRVIGSQSAAWPEEDRQWLASHVPDCIFEI